MDYEKESLKVIGYIQERLSSTYQSLTCEMSSPGELYDFLDAQIQENGPTLRVALEAELSSARVPPNGNFGDLIMGVSETCLQLELVWSKVDDLRKIGIYVTAVIHQPGYKELHENMRTKQQEAGCTVQAVEQMMRRWDTNESIRRKTARDGADEMAFHAVSYDEQANYRNSTRGRRGNGRGGRKAADGRGNYRGGNSGGSDARDPGGPSADTAKACWNCGEHGHVRHMCPKPKVAKASAVAQSAHFLYSAVKKKGKTPYDRDMPAAKKIMVDVGCSTDAILYEYNDEAGNLVIEDVFKMPPHECRG